MARDRTSEAGAAISASATIGADGTVYFGSGAGRLWALVYDPMTGAPSASHHTMRSSSADENQRR